jgi:peptide/nickel transport system substrate-binding protein
MGLQPHGASSGRPGAEPGFIGSMRRSTMSATVRRPAGAGLRATAFAAAIAGALLASVALAPTVGAAQGSADTLVIAENEPAQTLDPLQAGNSTVDQLVLLLYNSLVQYEPGASEPTGDLASEWEISDDGLTYTFTLNDATFHSGNPVTAADVKYTLDRIQRLNTGVASEIAAYDTSTVVDDSTIEVTLKTPFGAFVPALSRVYIVDGELVEANKGSDDGQTWLATNDAGSGPYQLTRYEANVTAEMSRFDDYFGEAGKMPNVVFQYIPEQATQRLALENGDVDLAMDILVADLQPLADAGFPVIASDTNVQLYAYFNTAGGATADPKVRQALTYAYDYQTHVDSILTGYGSVAQGALPKSMKCWTDDQTIPTYDPDQARALLAEAGFGEGGQPLSLKVTSLTAIEEHDKAAQLMQANFADIGVDLQIESVTFPQYIDLLKSVETSPDIGLIYAFPSNPDPNAVLFINYDSQFVGTGYNWGNYSNPEVDTLVREAQALTDEDQRCERYVTAQQLIADDAVAINISLPQHVVVTGPSVQGWAYNAAHHQTVNAADISVGE